MAKDKIAVTVDRALLAGAAALTRRTRESRSALVERALRRLLEEERRRGRIREYVEAYRRMPESTSEVRAAARVADETLRDLAWEDG